MVSLLKTVYSWSDFQSTAHGLSKKERGDLFENLTKYFLQIDPRYATELEHVWLLNEVPEKIRTKLNLPRTDQGIDIICETKTGEYWAVQCKYRSSDEHSLTWREISTFNGLAFSVCKHISLGLIAYTGERYAKVLNGAEKISFLSNDVWSDLNAEFFEAIHKNIDKKVVTHEPRMPRPHQAQAIKKTVKYFTDKTNVRGKLIMPCGAGKSLTGYWIAEALEAKLTIVAVPSLALIQQTLPVWLREYTAHNNADSLRWLCVCSDQTVTKQDGDAVVIHTQDLGYPCLTNSGDIRNWLKKTNDAKRRVIFTTYQSGKSIAEAFRIEKLTADLGIMDEAHKTVGQKDKLFSHLLFDENIAIRRRVFMTATERRFSGQSDDVLSMEDEAMYGKTIDLLTFKGALEQQPAILSDYKILTMVIAESEVKKLIESNKYIRVSGLKKEAEAQMYACAIALQKAMQKYSMKHAVSFHSSIARAKDFQAIAETCAENTTTLDTYHVTGAMPATTRKGIIRDFAASDTSLITNARCLTEGVDVPSIDCVLFADPKQSTIDIVQAVGRALRPVKGKEFGYVIVPVISKGESEAEFVESEAFKPVLTVLRALAGNDERIIEFFKGKYKGKQMKGGLINVEIDEHLAAHIDIAKFADAIELKAWSRLAQMSWRSYEEARDFVHKLGLKSRDDWFKYCKGIYDDLPKKPLDIPNDPPSVYNSTHFKEFREKGGWGGWLGTHAIAYRYVKWLPYDTASKFTKSLGLKSYSEWGAYCSGQMSNLPTLPHNIPKNPNVAYPEDYVRNGRMSGWLGRTYGTYRKDYWRSYSNAIIFVHSLKLKSGADWNAYCSGSIKGLPLKPIDIPADPNKHYGPIFKKNRGMAGWLGTDYIATKDREYLNYSDAKSFVLKLKIRTNEEWRKYCKGNRPDLGIKPSNIPAGPSRSYGDKFFQGGGWPGWLGNKNFKGGWRSFDEAISFNKKLNLKTQKEWKEYCKGNFKHLPKKPDDIPNNPYQIKEYKDKMSKVGIAGWLGKIE